MTRDTARDYILSGKVELPKQFLELVNSPEDEEVMSKFFKALWRIYLMNKGTTSTPYWSSQFTTEKKFNLFTYHLSKSGWIDSVVKPHRNWAEVSMNETKLLQYCTADELVQVRSKHKFQYYRMTDSRPTNSGDITKIGKERKDTGILREGLANAGNSPFKIDVPMLQKYKASILLNLNKSMDKLIPNHDGILMDEANYKACCIDVLEHIIANPESFYRTGTNYNDSRGRAISEVLSKVFNPISNKDCRSLLVIDQPQVMEPRAIKHVYLAIAELLGRKPKKAVKKVMLGMHSYINREYHTLSTTTNITPNMSAEQVEAELKRAEDDRKDLHENIWLERLYNELDRYFNHLAIDSNYSVRLHSSKLLGATKQLTSYLGKKSKWHKSRIPKAMLDIDKLTTALTYLDGVEFNWLVPIEKDGTASMIQIEGALFNHLPFLDLTNCTGSELKDAWKLDGVPRSQYKKAITPILYGSNQPAKELWGKAQITYTREQVRLFNKEITQGAMAVANMVKNFIIKNAQPKAEMNVVIMGETITIQCNRFKNVADYGVKYVIYNTAKGNYERIYHTHTRREPDLNQFKTYFVTLLVHSLDSRVADGVCWHEMNEPDGWVIPIHDAFIISPTSADRVTKTYCDTIDLIHDDRANILKEYFESIGIQATKDTAKEWNELKAHIVPAENFKCKPECLK